MSSSVESSEKDFTDHINQFISVFQKKLKRLEGYQFADEDGTYKKTILVSFLDALSITVIDPNIGNRKRMVKLIRGFSDWQHADRVSVPELVRLLENTVDSCFKEPLFSYMTELRLNYNGNMPRLHVDPLLEDVYALWPVLRNIRAGNVASLELLTHANLFYASRNILVHEQRASGLGWDVKGDSVEPYYLSHLSNRESSVELVYPDGFYFWLVQTVLLRVEKRLREKNTDPYSRYSFGSSYIPTLNQ